MTMLIPTADSLPGALPFSLAAIPGLPDEAALARLAGELFRALPGSEASSSPSLPGASGLAIGEPGPALQPVAAPSAGQVPVEEGKTKVLLLRVGDKRQGVVGLYQPGLPGEQSPGLSVRFMGIDRNAIASYLISLYCSLAVHTEDALAVLDDVEIDKYHDYADTYR